MQSDEHSCGFAAAQMVLNHFNISFRRAELVEELKVYKWPKGVLPWTMRKVMKSYGLSSSSSFSMYDLADVNLVCLGSPLHWVVWYGTSRKEEYVQYDPAEGQIKPQYDRFLFGLPVSS